MDAPPGSLRRIVIAGSIIAALVAVVVAVALFSWSGDRQAVIDFACNGKITSFRPEDEYTRSMLIVTNEDGSIVVLESRALALTERDTPTGAQIVKRRSEPDGLIDNRPVTFLRER